MIVVIWVYHTGVENARGFSVNQVDFEKNTELGYRKAKWPKKLQKLCFSGFGCISGFPHVGLIRDFAQRKELSCVVRKGPKEDSKGRCWSEGKFPISSEREKFWVCALLAFKKRTKRTWRQTVGAQGFEAFYTWPRRKFVRFWFLKSAHFSKSKSLDLWEFFRDFFVLFVRCAFCALFFRLPPCARARTGGTCFFDAQNAQDI